MGQSKKWPKNSIPRSDSLPSLRRTLKSVDLLMRLIGPIAEFHIVIDANILIREILWILEKSVKSQRELACTNASWRKQSSPMSRQRS